MTTSGGSRLGWYVRRAARMTPAEAAWRVRDQALRAAWSGKQVTRAHSGGPLPAGWCPRRLDVVLPPAAAGQVPSPARAALLAAASRLMLGSWEVLGVPRTDLAGPDWFWDPVTGRRSPSQRCAFRINPRSPEQAGDVKQVWELSRLQHLTVLAAAWFLTHDEVYARRVADQLRSWWQQNPFLSGVHWTSGIEIGLRLISMTWIRRLMSEWPGAGDLFEGNDLAVRQIHWHQSYLAAFPSRGSSANNHVIAEAAGQLVASCAFPWFPDSGRWRRDASRRLERELLANTFPSGIGRELASGYHCFVAELGLVAAAEARASGHPLADASLRRLRAMADGAAGLLDAKSRPPRQGDSDEGRALLLDDPSANCWLSLLALGGGLFGRLGWWPRATPDVRATLVAALTGEWRDEGADRPARRPWRFPDAGITLLRTAAAGEPEIWCRCDGGPHGYLRIAAHAHADALSVEVRHGGVDILADPGASCYHGDPAWRAYFRSSVAHNTLEIGGRSQSRDGGPFLWLSHANSREIEVVDTGDIASWTAEHDGYHSLRPPARHRRTVRLDRVARSVEIADVVLGGSHEVRLALHLGPDVQVELDGTSAFLRWPGPAAPGTGQLRLPPELSWSLHRGETDPILGWYAPALGQRIPTFALIGRGRTTPRQVLRTQLQLAYSTTTANRAFTPPAVSPGRSSALMPVRRWT